MFSTSRWLAKLRYNRRVKRLQNDDNDRGTTSGVRSEYHPYNRRIDATLVRAGKNKLIEEAMMRRRNTTDVVSYPFTLPAGSQGHRRYVLYNRFYCIFPVPDQTQAVGGALVPPSTLSGSTADESVLMAYSAWLTKCKSEHPLNETLLGALKKADRKFIHEDTVYAINHFLVSHKFAYGGYVFTDPEGVGGDTTVSLVYYRANPMIKSGLMIEPNLFFLKESHHDASTKCQISDHWSWALVDGMTQPPVGMDTDITSVPPDKTLYAVVTAPLKHEFYTQPPHTAG